MSNIVLANMVPAAPPKPQDSDAVKLSSGGKRNTAVQNDVSGSEDTDNVSSSPENPDTNPTAKSKQKEDFTSILQKQLSGDASSENPQTSESQDTGQNPAPIANGNSDSDGKAKSETDGETKKEAEQALSVGFFVLQPSQPLPKQVALVTSDSKTAGTDPQQAKTTQTILTVSSATAQVAAASRQNAVSAAAVTNKSSELSPALPQVITDVSKKMTADTVEIKNTPPAGQTAIRPANPTFTDIAATAVQKQTDNIEKANLSSTSNFSMTKESVAIAQEQTQGQTQAQAQTQTQQTQAQFKTSLINEANKANKGLAELNQQPKSPVMQTKDSSVVVQTVTTEPAQTVVRPTVSMRSDTELLTQSISSSAGAEKSSFQQVFLKPSEQIIDQIQTTIAGPVQQIRVTLSPEELGTVRITFRQTNGQMEGLVEVQNPEVRKEVEKALPQIAAALTQNGIQIRRMDIASMPTQQQMNQESFQSPGRDFGAADQYYADGQGGSGFPKGGGSAGVSQQFAEQAESSQSRPQQNYDLAGLNMYA